MVGQRKKKAKRKRQKKKIARSFILVFWFEEEKEVVAMKELRLGIVYSDLVCLKFVFVFGVGVVGI